MNELFVHKFLKTPLGRQSLVLRRDAKGIWWNVTATVAETPGSPQFNAWKHNLVETKSWVSQSFVARCYQQGTGSDVTCSVRHQHKGVFPPVHWAHDASLTCRNRCNSCFWFPWQIKFDQHNLLPSLTQKDAGLCAGTITFSTHWTTPCRMRPYEWLFGENYSILKMACVPSFLKSQVHLLPSKRIYDITPEVITQKHWTFRILLGWHW